MDTVKIGSRWRRKDDGVTHTVIARRFAQGQGWLVLSECRFMYTEESIHNYFDAVEDAAAR